MYRVSFIIAFVVAVMLFGCTPSPPSVLLLLRERGEEGAKPETYEAVEMKRMLEEAGFKVAMASVSGLTDSVLKLRDVKAVDYAGFMVPCMNLRGEWIARPGEAAIVKQAVAAGKPIAAQHGALIILGEAGVMKGRRYAARQNLQHLPEFADAVYSDIGVVQDRSIITSADCPRFPSDGTVELTQLLIAELKK